VVAEVLTPSGSGFVTIETAGFGFSKETQLLNVPEGVDGSKPKLYCCCWENPAKENKRKIDIVIFFMLLVLFEVKLFYKVTVISYRKLLVELYKNYTTLKITKSIEITSIQRIWLTIFRFAKHQYKVKCCGNVEFFFNAFLLLKIIRICYITTFLSFIQRF
jgi:hypothetical protein